jgi:hypothetical protein
MMTDEPATNPEPTPNPEPAPEPAPKKRVRSAQDQKTINTLNERRAALTAVLNNADATTRLEPRGYNAANLNEGLTLGEAVQSAFTDRQLAKDTRDAAFAALDAADLAARTGLRSFRRIAGGVFATNTTARETLNLNARISDDRQKLIGLAETTYQAALSRSTYLAALSKRGYDEAALNAELAKITALRQAEAAALESDQSATRATARRKDAAKAFDLWWKEFTATASVAFEGRQDLLGLLGL